MISGADTTNLLKQVEVINLFQQVSHIRRRFQLLAEWIMVSTGGCMENVSSENFICWFPSVAALMLVPSMATG